jgi:hypothetical protein
MEINSLEQLFLDMDKDLRIRDSRIGKQGDWCVFCGGTERLGSCSCALPESLRCVGNKLCAECSAAHCLVANHLKRALAARRVDRVSSIRAKFYYQIHEAAEQLEQGSKLPLERRLHAALSAADPYEDEGAEFRTNLLGAFRAVRFTDFQGLAAKLRAEMENEAKMHLARYFSSCVV